MSSGGVPQETCSECGGRGWVVAADGGAGSASPCSCQAEQRGPKLLAAAAIPDRYLGCRFDTFNVERPQAAEKDVLLEALSRSKRYVDDFLTDSGGFSDRGLLFLGPPGVGKTHLAVAVLKELISRYRVRGRFEDFTSLIHQIQATFEPGTVDSKNAILRRVSDAELLVLDELGAQKPSAWVTEILYLVINNRYNRRLPTIFTTNLRLDPPSAEGQVLDREHFVQGEDPLAWRVPARLLSRLYEMALPISIQAGDFRREFKAHPHAC